MLASFLVKSLPYFGCALSLSRPLAGVAAAAFCLASLLVTGCASPGHPSPPSLQVPRVVTDLTASRSGAEVHLHWTTPTRTTDGVTLALPISAEICRSAPPLPAKLATAPPCSVVRTLAVRPGASEATDTLPPPLASGSPALLIYQVQLRGSLGKTAGPSTPAYTATGSAPPAVASLRASDTKPGALLEWTPDPGTGRTVEITRTVVSSPGAPAPATPARAPNPFRPRPQAGSSGPAVTHLSAGSADSGGALDRTAELGATYEYSAQRVVSVVFASHTVEFRSTPSPPVSLTLRDIFPPNPPAGLVSSPGPGSIDLSWEPDTDARTTGYRVYRAEAAAAGGGSANTPANWTLLTPELLTTPSYRDLTVATGHTYRYRVTAVDSTGNESAPSNVAMETTTTEP